jgi:hypothetical protein
MCIGNNRTSPNVDFQIVESLRLRFERSLTQKSPDMEMLHLVEANPIGDWSTCMPAAVKLVTALPKQMRESHQHYTGEINK